MKKLFKKILLVFLATFGTLITPFMVLAQETPKENTIEIDLPPGSPSGLKALTNNAFGTFSNVFGLIFGLAFTLTVLALIANGIRYIVAFGNEEQVEKAKNGVYYSILGLVILLLAFTIASTINYIFTLQK